jgi:hypothetical protein
VARAPVQPTMRVYPSRAQCPRRDRHARQTGLELSGSGDDRDSRGPVPVSSGDARRGCPVRAGAGTASQPNASSWMTQSAGDCGARSSRAVPGVVPEGTKNQPSRGNSQPSRRIVEVVKLKDFRRKNKDGREADRRLADRCRLRNMKCRQVVLATSEWVTSQSELDECDALSALDAGTSNRSRSPQCHGTPPPFSRSRRPQYQWRHGSGCSR